MDHILTLLILFPFFGALLAIGIKENLRAYGIIIGVIELILSLFLWIFLIKM